MTSTLVKKPMAVLTKKRHVNIPNYGTTSDSGPSLFYGRTFLSQVPACEESSRLFYDQLAERHAELKKTRSVSARRHIFTLADEGRDLLLADKKGANLFTPKQRKMASLLMSKMGDPWQDKLTLGDVERFLRHSGISFPLLTLAAMFREAQLFADEGHQRGSDGDGSKCVGECDSSKVDGDGGAATSTTSPRGGDNSAPESLSVSLSLGELEVAVSGCVQGRKHNYDWQLLAELVQQRPCKLSQPRAGGKGDTLTSDIVKEGTVRRSNTAQTSVNATRRSGSATRATGAKAGAGTSLANDDQRMGANRAMDVSSQGPGDRGQQPGHPHRQQGQQGRPGGRPHHHHHHGGSRHKTTVAERRQAWALQSSGLHAPGQDGDPIGGTFLGRRSWDGSNDSKSWDHVHNNSLHYNSGRRHDVVSPHSYSRGRGQDVLSSGTGTGRSWDDGISTVNSGTVSGLGRAHHEGRSPPQHVGLAAWADGAGGQHQRAYQQGRGGGFADTGREEGGDGDAASSSSSPPLAHPALGGVSLEGKRRFQGFFAAIQVAGGTTPGGPPPGPPIGSNGPRAHTARAAYGRSHDTTGDNNTVNFSVSRASAGRPLAQSGLPDKDAEPTKPHAGSIPDHGSNSYAKALSLGTARGPQRARSARSQQPIVELDGTGGLLSQRGTRQFQSGRSSSAQHTIGSPMSRSAMPRGSGNAVNTLHVGGPSGLAAHMRTLELPGRQDLGLPEHR